MDENNRIRILDILSGFYKDYNTPEKTCSFLKFLLSELNPVIIIIHSNQNLESPEKLSSSITRISILYEKWEEHLGVQVNNCGTSKRIYQISKKNK